MRTFSPDSGIPANIINHNVLWIDESWSMNAHRHAVVKAVDAHIAYLAGLSKELDQETRVTVYTFSDRGGLRCLFYDKDVLRMPSIEGLYHPRMRTALAEALLVGLDELGQTPQLHGDHSFLGFAFTDGWENDSTERDKARLPGVLTGLPENWTIGAFVPGPQYIHAAKKLGFPGSNVAVWDTTSSRGFTEAGETMRAASEGFMRGRANGVRGYSRGGLFTMDVNAADVAAEVPALNPGQYWIYDIRDGGDIRETTEDLTGAPYLRGSAYYELTKKETIQPQKEIAIQRGGQVYSGREARRVLGLPDMHVQVGPGHLDGCTIFVQSTSVNRKLMPGTRLLVMR